jgi:hypothetical protein
MKYKAGVAFGLHPFFVCLRNVHLCCAGETGLDGHSYLRKYVVIVRHSTNWSMMCADTVLKRLAS